jgi:hypothetical protein
MARAAAFRYRALSPHLPLKGGEPAPDLIRGRHVKHGGWGSRCDPSRPGFAGLLRMTASHRHIARILAVTSICVVAFAAGALAPTGGQMRCSNSRATGVVMKRVRSAFT